MRIFLSALRTETARPTSRNTATTNLGRSLLRPYHSGAPLRTLAVCAKPSALAFPSRCGPLAPRPLVPTPFKRWNSTTPSSGAPSSGGVETALSSSSSSFLDNFDGYVSYGILNGGDVAWWEYPFLYMNLGLEVIQLKYDIPWWAMIAGVSLFLRIVFSYPTIKQIRTSMIIKSFEKEIEKSRSMDMAENWANQKAIYQKHGVSLWKNTMYSVGQIPFVLLAFWSIRGLCIRPEYVDLASGGLWWFKDLTAVDPYYALPLITGLAMLISNEIYMKATGTAPGFAMKYGSRAFSVFFCWICLSFPMGVNIYWLTTSLFMAFLNVLLCLNPVRKYFGIPSKTPPVRYISLSDTSSESKSANATTTTIIHKPSSIDYSRLNIRPKKAKK